MTCSNEPRAGKGFLKFLVTVVIVAVIAYVGWVTYSNYQRTGEVDPGAVLDEDKRNAAHDDARPAMDKAIELAGDAKAMLSDLASQAFGDGGYVDQAAEWMKSDDSGQSPVAAAVSEANDQAPAASGPTPTTSEPTPSAPVRPEKSSETRRLEARIVEAEQIFGQALEHYEAANPANGGWTASRAQAVKDAARGFEQVRDICYAVLDDYEARPDHSPAVAAKARQMQQHNQKLLHTSKKMTAAF